MTLDVAKIRSSYPALSDGYAYLDGAAGTQIPSSVIEAISGAYLAGLGNVGGAFPASHRSGEIVPRLPPSSRRSRRRRAGRSDPRTRT